MYKGGRRRKNAIFDVDASVKGLERRIWDVITRDADEVILDFMIKCNNIGTPSYPSTRLCTSVQCSNRMMRLTNLDVVLVVTR